MTPDDIKRICTCIKPCFEPTPGAMAMMLAVAEAAREECLAAVKAIPGRNRTHDAALTKAENAIKALRAAPEGGEKGER